MNSNATPFQVRNDIDSSKSSSIKVEAFGNSKTARRIQMGMKMVLQAPKSTKVVVPTEKEEIISTPIVTPTKASIEAVGSVPEDFVARIQITHEQIRGGVEGCHTIHPVASNGMYHIAKRLFELQSEFAAKGKPCEVILAYHYTKDCFVENISRNGLIQNIGGLYGPGIYCGNNPCAFQHFGPIGFIVAILKGKGITCGKYNSSVDDFDTKIGNKKLGQGSKTGMDFDDEIVLVKPNQCLPLIQFNAKGFNQSSFQDKVWKYHVEMAAVIENFYNARLTKSHRMNKGDSI